MRNLASEMFKVEFSRNRECVFETGIEMDEIKMRNRMGRNQITNLQTRPLVTHSLGKTNKFYDLVCSKPKLGLFKT